MSACPIRKLEVEDLLTKTNIVDGRRIINKPLFNQLNQDLQKYHKDTYGLDNSGLPFLTSTNKDTNPNNTTESRLGNNRYSELYTVNDSYYDKLQILADNKEKYALTFEEVESLYEEESEPEGLQELINSGKVTQFCSR